VSGILNPMLRVEREGPIVHITLNRPGVRNAFNDELIAHLTEAFASLLDSDRVVILRGEGTSFCAGGDLEWMRRAAAYTFDENVRDATALSNLFRTISEAKPFTIAIVQGHCFGGGCGLAAAVDCSLALDGTLFSFSEVKLGLIPATIGPFVMKRIGLGHARRYFGSGEIFDASDAYRIGLASESGGQEDLEKKFGRIVKSVLSSGPNAVANAKQLALNPPSSGEEAATRLATVRSGDEAKEGIDAFLSKRPAAYITEAPVVSLFRPAGEKA